MCLKRTGDPLASDCDQSDVYVCPKHGAGRHETQSITIGNQEPADELTEVRGLDPAALKQRWQVHYRTEAPVRIGQILLLQAVAYRLQQKALGGLKPSTRRLLERTAEDSFHRRTPSEAPATRVTPGSVLIREWRDQPSRNRCSRMV